MKQVAGTANINRQTADQQAELDNKCKTNEVRGHLYPLFPIVQA